MKLHAIFLRRGPRQLPHSPHPISTTGFGPAPALRPQVTSAPGHTKKNFCAMQTAVTKPG